MAPLFPWVEANAGLASIGLSSVAIVCAFYLAYVEHARAERAEDARMREPAAAALAIVDLVLADLRSVLSSDIEVTAQAYLVHAQANARRYETPLKQIASTPVPNAELIFALHSVAASMAHVGGIAVPDYHEAARTSFCEQRIQALEVYRRTLERFAQSKTPSARSRRPKRMTKDSEPSSTSFSIDRARGSAELKGST